MRVIFHYVFAGLLLIILFTPFLTLGYSGFENPTAASSNLEAVSSRESQTSKAGNPSFAWSDQPHPVAKQAGGREKLGKSDVASPVRASGEGLDDVTEGDGGWARLVVGVDVSRGSVQDLERVVVEGGGRVAGSVSVANRAEAFVVEVQAQRSLPLAEQLRASGMVRYVEPDSRLSVSYTPNDPYWSSQWGPQKIEADKAWDITTGSSSVLVAIVDTGIDYTHPDLAENYVPLGYNWVSNTTDPLDDFGHGTHCAGIVAARLNNNVGIAGMAQVHVMAEKVLSADGFGYDSWVAEGIIHATDEGARIISLSLGGPFDSSVLHDAVKYSYDHGVLIVAAAGNDGRDTKNYPAAYSEVVSVSATDSFDIIAPFSTYGDWIELSAPGVDIYSTMPTYNVTLNDYGYYLNYDYLSGTSMACPCVAGAAALAWSAFPNCTRDQIRNLLQRTADDLGDVGLDTYYGWGRVNARKAVEGLPAHDMSANRMKGPYRIDPGQPATFNATIVNCGRSNETDISLQLLANGTLARVETIGFLEAATPTVLALVWNTTIVGNYNITCYVVPVAGENNTRNNAASWNVAVRFPTVFSVPSDYPTIKEALKNALTDDSVLVNQGSYTEGQIDISKDSIKLITSGSATINGPGVASGSVFNIVANNVIIEGFTLQNGNNAISVHGDGNNFTGNTIFNNYCGIDLYYSCDNFVGRNSVSGNTLGIFLEHSRGNSVIGNYVTSNRGTGILINDSPGSTLRNNTMVGNDNNFGVQSIYADERDYVQDVDTSNTVDGRPLCYWVSKQDLTVPAGVGYVALIKCANITVQGLSLVSNVQGVLIVSTTNVTVVENSMAYNHASIYVERSSNIIITGNNVGSKWDGVWLTLSTNIRMVGNDIRGCGGRGIEFRVSDSNTVSGNTFTANQAGILLGDSSNNTIMENNMTTSDMWSICFEYSSGNSIMENNLGDTPMGLFDFSENNRIFHNAFRNVPVKGDASLTNVWDDSYPSGGNYWSDYNGTDMLSGPFQNVTGSDGIGDTPYTINVDNVDHYPLMKPYVSPPSTFLTITTEVGGATIPAPGIYSCTANSTLQVTAVPEPGYLFDRWQLDGINASSANPYSVLMDNNHTLNAIFFLHNLHDVAVTNATRCKTLVDQGYSLNVTVMLSNFGDYTETFNVTACANTTSFASQTVALPRGNAMSITVTWNTTGFAYGNYTVSVTAGPVQGETNTDDNNCTAGQVLVTIQGDVDADFRVTMGDINALCDAFGSTTGNPRFDPNCDIDDNRRIDMGDINVALDNFGRHYP